jgi:ATPase family associated with various cellular activities (AAA)
MEKFVNRDEELMLVDDAVDTLLDRKRLLRTPIIEFYGVDGIGKTTLLRKVEKQCFQKSVTSIWADSKDDTFYHFIKATKDQLDEKKPVVVILDSLDAASEEQLQRIEAGLNDLIDNSNLFVVLASRRMLKFDNNRSIALKLTALPLKPLNQESCKEYLDNIGSESITASRDTIFEWTRGYPLAMDAMVDAIQHDKLNPYNEEDKKSILTNITRRVIDRGLLSSVKLSEHPKYKTLLSLLSVARRFNLVIMQDIIEAFARQYQLESSLAYITLPTTINQVTNVLSWNMFWAGYCIDAPVRNIFLLKLKIEEPEKYYEINRLLAQINKRFAQEVTGSDRVRYLREFFYHLANSGDTTDFPSIIREQLEPLTQEKSLENFLQFYEEFLQDEELKEALGERNTNLVISYIRRKFVEKYIRDLEIPVSERVHLLREFFLHTTPDPKVDDFPLIFEQGMRQIIQEESPVISIKLYADLLHDEGLQALLGKDYDRIASLIYEKLSEEK